MVYVASLDKKIQKKGWSCKWTYKEVRKKLDRVFDLDDKEKEYLVRRRNRRKYCKMSNFMV